MSAHEDLLARHRKAGRIMEESRENGLLVDKGGVHGNVLRIAPPLTLTKEEADLGFEILNRAVETAQAQEETL